MQSARYFARRRVNPYRGVEQVVDVGEASALSLDGAIWHVYGETGFAGWRPIGVWCEERGQIAGGAALPKALIEALQHRPPLPFALADRWELWLLERANGLPLALLDTACPSAGIPAVSELVWHPFVLTYTGFVSASLSRAQAGQRAPDRHRDVLARIVNEAARPYPAAQWFCRALAGAGSGEGMDGFRLRPEWRKRTLPATAFPELLVRAPESTAANNLLEKSVIDEYHAHLAALLLLLPGLATATRAALEIAAMAHPAKLERVHRLLPKVADAARIAAIRVAARLESAAAGGAQ